MLRGGRPARPRHLLRVSCARSSTRCARSRTRARGWGGGGALLCVLPANPRCRLTGPARVIGAQAAGVGGDKPLTARSLRGGCLQEDAGAGAPVASGTLCGLGSSLRSRRGKSEQHLDGMEERPRHELEADSSKCQVDNSLTLGSKRCAHRFLHGVVVKDGIEGRPFLE